MKIDAGGSSRPSGTTTSVVTRNLGMLQPVSWQWWLKNFVRHRRRAAIGDVATKFLGGVCGVATFHSSLEVRHYSRSPVALPLEIAQRLHRLLASNVDVRELTRHFGGTVTDYGVVSTRLVTDAGVAFLVDALQNLTEPENFKFHGYGTGTTAEAASQTALVTELTTQYVTDNVRPTGSQTENAANVYRTVGTLSPDTGGTIAITEHAIFSATAAGTMLDRSVFSAINVVAAADSLQTTYDFTIASGG